MTLAALALEVAIVESPRGSTCGPTVDARAGLRAIRRVLYHPAGAGGRRLSRHPPAAARWAIEDARHVRAALMKVLFHAGAARNPLLRKARTARGQARSTKPCFV